MMNINNTNWQILSDSSIFENIGIFIKHNRIEQNKTQEDLAYEAGINRSTLAQCEMGKQKVSLMTLIRLLRALNKLDVLETFSIVTKISPIKLAKLQQEKRKRASKKSTIKQAPKSDW